MDAPAPAGRVLVVAGTAAESDELLAELVARSRRAPLELTLIVPAPAVPARRAEDRAEAEDAARRRLRSALSRFRAAGLYVREAGVGEGGPVVAVAEALASGEVSEIVVATPIRRGWWRRPDAELAQRLREATGLPVTQVLGQAPGRAGRAVPARAAVARRLHVGRERPALPRRTRRRDPGRRGEVAVRPSAAWLRSAQPPPPPTGAATVLRLQASRALGAVGFVLLALAAAGATNG